MTTDIFKLLKRSIEEVKVKKTERGTLDEDTVFEVTVDSIIKRRNGMAESTNDSEDRNTQTTMKFRCKDAQYIQEGNFVLLDGVWRVIERYNVDINYVTGKGMFIKAFIGDQIVGNPTDPDWTA